MAVKAVYVELLEEQMCPCQKRKLEQALDNAKAEIATLNTQIEALNTTVAEKDNRITELENQVANSMQPNENSEETTQLPDVSIHLSAGLSGLPNNLTQGQAFERTVSLTATSGSSEHYYPFEFSISNNEQYVRYSLGNIGAGNSNDFQDLMVTPNGTVTGKIRGDSGDHSLIVQGIPVQSGDDIEFPTTGWHLSYTANLASGEKGTDRNVDIEDAISISPASLSNHEPEIEEDE